MNMSIRACLCLSIVLFGGCAFLLGEREHLSFFPDDGNWRVGHSQSTSEGQVLEYVRNGETIENWTELLTVMNFRKTSTPPEAVMNTAKAQMEQRCQGVTWEVIDRQDLSILYEWRTDDCASSPHHRSVARWVDGKWNRWFIAYETKIKDWPVTERNRWIGLLSKAKAELDTP